MFESLSILRYNLNSSKYFAGIMMILLNLGSRFLVSELSETQEQFLNNTIIRRFIIFTIVFIATRDVWVALILTTIFIVLVSNLFNENSYYCVMRKQKKIEHIKITLYLMEKYLIHYLEITL